MDANFNSRYQVPVSNQVYNKLFFILQDRETITRFLQSAPVLVNSKPVSAQNRSRYFWGNLPGMDRLMFPQHGDKLNLQDCLEPNCGRLARLEKVGGSYVWPMKKS